MPKVVHLGHVGLQAGMTATIGFFILSNAVVMDSGNCIFLKFQLLLSMTTTFDFLKFQIMPKIIIIVLTLKLI